jgi:hypothetical protein
VEILAGHLREAAEQLAAAPSPQSMARLLRCFLVVLDAYRDELRQQNGARLWRLATQYVEAAESLAQSSSLRSGPFERLPALMARLPWVDKLLAAMQGCGDVPVRIGAQLRRFEPAAGHVLLREARQSEAGAFCAMAHHLQNRLETRMREVWLLEEFRNADPGPIDLYASAHRGLFPAFQPTPDSGRVAAEMTRMAKLAAAADLPEIAACLEAPAWMAQYAIQHLMPPDPPGWAPRFLEQFDRLLVGRVSRWYLYPFLHWPEPLELAATVLRLGRPQYYERTAAQALLEYRLLGTAAVFEPDRLGHYLDACRVLEFQFQTHFEGYLLRLFAAPKLKHPEGWCWYFDALRRLRNAEIPLPELDDFRRDFLGRRGCPDTAALLCRLAGSGTVQ